MSRRLPFVVQMISPAPMARYTSERLAPVHRTAPSTLRAPSFHGSRSWPASAPTAGRWATSPATASLRGRLLALEEPLERSAEHQDPAAQAERGEVPTGHGSVGGRPRDAQEPGRLGDGQRRRERGLASHGYILHGSQSATRVLLRRDVLPCIIRSVPSLALFDWPAPTPGYRWLVARAQDVRRPRDAVRRHAGDSGRAWLLVPAEPCESARRSLPLRDAPALFRTLAELDPGDPDAVLAFASRNGWLGLGEREPELGQLVPDDTRPGRLLPAEGLAEWAEAVYGVRQAVELLDAAQAGDERRLRRWIRAGDEWATYQRREASPSREAARRAGGKRAQVGHLRPASLTFHLDGRDHLDARSPLSDYLREGDVVRAARFFAQRMITRGLAEHTRAALVFDPETRAQGLHVVPWNLLGALWIQTAGLAEGGRDYERCETCRGWFVLSPEYNRADRRYCSDACRHKAYRERRRQAQVLHREGMAPSKIARELGSNTPTVRRWLGLAPRRDTQR